MGKNSSPSLAILPTKLRPPIDDPQGTVRAPVVSAVELASHVERQIPEDCSHSKDWNFEESNALRGIHPPVYESNRKTPCSIFRRFPAPRAVEDFPNYLLRSNP